MTAGSSFRERWAALRHGTYVVLVDVLRRPSLFYGVAALLATYLGKISWHNAVLSKANKTEMGFLAFFAEDLLFLTVLSVIVWSIENRWPHRFTKISTAILMGLIALFSTLNVVWLNKTGFQLSSSIIHIGLTRFEEIEPIIRYEIGWLALTGLAMVLIAPAVLARAFQWKWNIRDYRGRSLHFVALPLIFLFLSGQGYWQRRNPDLVYWRRIADNMFFGIARTMAQEDYFAAGLPAVPEVVPSPEVVPAQFPVEEESSPAPNIVVVFWESVSHRASSFNPYGRNATPTLKKVADAGMEVAQMRVVMPHSTKTFYTTLCGKVPALQQEIVETANNYPMSCLPAIFRDRGYETAFIQASEGDFEDLPRLAHNIGFNEFIDGNNIEPKPDKLGYLGADDAVLAEVVPRWAEQQDKPFFLALFTSATHHPYVLPERLKRGPDLRVHQAMRYLLLTRDADFIVERMLGLLENKGLLDNTIVVMMGDHGESFGDHGQYQHDNVYTEEGLRIPFAMMARGRIEPGTIVRENRTVLDVAPTILDLTEVPYRGAALDGTSLLSPVDEDQRQFFSCFYNNACVGFVQRNVKTVLFPKLDSWLVYDLQTDPKENTPQLEPVLPEGQLAQLLQWYAAHRYRPGIFNWPEQELFGGQWSCGKDYGECRFNQSHEASKANPVTRN